MKFPTTITTTTLLLLFPSIIHAKTSPPPSGLCNTRQSICGDKCCAPGQVCAQSANGPAHCWPAAGRPDFDRLAGGASPAIWETQGGAERARARARATSTPGPVEGERNGSARLSVSMWLCVLVLLTPFVAAVGSAELESDGVEVGGVDAIPAVMIEGSAPTATSSTALSTSISEHEVQIDPVEKKGAAVVAAAGAGAAGAAAHKSGKKSAGSRTISLDTIWPVMLFALPQMFAPLALAELVAGSATPAADMVDNNNDLSVMSTPLAATLLPDELPTINLSQKKKFKFGSGSGSSQAVSSRPEVVTRPMLYLLALLALLGLGGIFILW
ncbi:hypothetical protein J1614_001378 [Plenodomus biglobosus]|nr:hypothetical protein J1614_001378 [Plenodomus biglobosus]